MSLGCEQYLATPLVDCRQRGTEVRVRDVDNYEYEDVEWADAVLSVGGERSIRVF